MTARVTAPAAGNALVDIEIYDSAGVRVHQAVYDNQAFAAGQQRSFTTGWRVPSGARKGTYTVRVGVFSPGWGTMYAWNNSAATFTVR